MWEKRKRFLVLGILAVFWLAGVLFFVERGTRRQGGAPTPAPPTAPLATFASCRELKAAIEENAAMFDKIETLGLGAPTGGAFRLGAPTAPSSATPALEGVGLDYTRTNIQVEGVDEADIVKTDGSYLYAITGNRIAIVRATPPETAALLATVKLEEDAMPSGLFVHGDFLAVFGERRMFVPLPKPSLPPMGSSPGTPPEPGGSGVEPDPGAEELEEDTVSPSALLPPFSSNPVTFLAIYRLGDRTAPTLVRTVEFEGRSLASRKIDDMLYLVLGSEPEVSILRGVGAPFAQSGEGSGEGVVAETALVPRFREARGPISSAQPFDPIVGCDRVSYPKPFLGREYLTVVGVPIDAPEAEIVKEVVLGAGTAVYASPENLYVAAVSYRPILPILEERIQGLAPLIEETVVHAFHLGRDAISYSGQGRVPGRVLNQFSMDEYGGNFRIATTVTASWDIAGRERPSRNAVYILDAQLNRIGALEDIAPGETIYSARFMGDRAYLVTFKKVDPFFAIDLADPRHPRILGELKVPGFSDYLHPFDTTHIIGVGKNAEDMPEEEFAWYEGMKLALFDVTDPEHPRELHRVDIGDRGTDSEALRDHHAFLFDPTRHLLVLPILLAEIPPERKALGSAPLEFPDFGNPVFQGSYIYDLTLEEGFVLRGRVSHLDDPVAYFRRNRYDAGDGALFIRRDLRIGDYLYSISEGKILVHALRNLEKVADIPLPR